MNREAMMVTQYKQCYEHLREHGKHMWYIPFGTGSLMVALIVAAFHYAPASPWFVSPIILAVGIALHLCSLQRIIKHRYFCTIWANTLSSIEDEFQVKHIQLFTEPEDNADYWNKPQPSQRRRCLEKWSAHNVTVRCMWAILAILGVAFIVSLLLISCRTGRLCS
jgi:hypothetical protein